MSAGSERGRSHQSEQNKPPAHNWGKNSLEYTIVIYSCYGIGGRTMMKTKKLQYVRERGRSNKKIISKKNCVDHAHFIPSHPHLLQNCYSPLYLKRNFGPTEH